MDFMTLAVTSAAAWQTTQTGPDAVFLRGGQIPGTRTNEISFMGRPEDFTHIV